MTALAWLARGPAAPAVTDPAEIDAAYRRQRLKTIVIITLGYGLLYTCRLGLGVVKKPLIDAGVFSPAQLGLIGSGLFYGYAIGKLINGFVADHVNPRAFFVLGMVVSALCNLGMGMSTSVGASLALWTVNGWFQSFCAPACVIALTQWFSNRERGFYYGVWTTSHSIGEGLTFAAVGALVAALGWRAGFIGPALVCLGTAVAAWLMLSDGPRSRGLPPVADYRNDHWQGEASKVHDSLLRTQLSILAIPQVWVLAVSSALMYVSRYAINSWGVLYLQEARGYSLTAAGSLLAVNTFAGVVGAVAFGWVSDKWFGARRPPANLLFGLVEIVGLVIIFFGPTSTPVLALGLILFGFGLTGLVASVGGLFATDICPKRVAGAALGLVGVFSYLGAAIQEQVSGALIQKGMTVVNGVRHYDFSQPILFWIGASVVSLVLATTLWNAKLRD